MNVVNSSVATASSYGQLPELSLEVVIAEIAARRDEFDVLSHVPRDMIATMARARIFRASTPKCFGGDAAPPADFMRVLERIAIVDGSAAWVAAFGSANVYLAALPRETQQEIYATGPDQVFTGGLYPMQRARAVPGGWRATGQWNFASGCLGANWLGVGIDGGDAVTGPRPMTAVLPADAVEIVENWDVVGMRGTGSHDLRLQDKFISERWTCVRGASGVIDEPLYHYPAVSYQAGVHAAVNLGLARAALDLVTGMAANGRTSTGAPRLADRAYFRSELARAEAKWHSARAFFYESSERTWNEILIGNPVSPPLANMLRLSATHAAQTSADIVQQAYRLAGIAAIYHTHPLQRLVRDSMVVTQHALLGDGTYEGAGAIFAGVAPATAYP